MAEPTYLPSDGEWTRDGSWNEALSACLCREEAEAGLDALRRAVPPRHIARLLRTEPSKPGHPLGQDYVFRFHRFTVVEFAVALLRFGPRRIRERIRNPADYVGFQREQLAGLVFQGTGATMLHEPLGRVGSLDWLAEWPCGCALAVEVKCPQESKQSRKRSLIVTHFHWALMAKFHSSPAVRADTGTWINLALTNDFIRRMGDAQLINDEGKANPKELDRVASDAMRFVDELSWPAPDGTYSLGDAGTMRIARGAGAEPVFHFSGSIIPSDSDHEEKRIRDDLMEAADQLKRNPERAGLVYLDAACDMTLRSKLPAVQDLLREPWAAELAGVLLVDSSFNGTPDRLAMFVPGAREEEAGALLDGLRCCQHGHFHADTGVFPQAACEPQWV
ncbi:MAG TPA: hypothetical protein VJN18_00785 [Polyangiaceae bacterium]|nr:hypothetical protein [Polyangiaceae bacterium]